MNIKELKDLIQEVLASDIQEFELEHTGTKVKLRRMSQAREELPIAESAAAPSSQPPHRPAETPSSAAPPPQPREEEQNGLHIITSPIVGTFYSSPAPDAEAFVKVGDMVEEGTILCIIEAMKLMNEIPSDVTGEVARIYVQNNHPVEFGQKLFGIRPQK